MMQLKHVLAAGAILLAMVSQAMADGLLPAAEHDLHTEWTALLASHVVHSADGVDQFDYARLKGDPASRRKLDAYIASFETLDFDALARDAAFAAWANLYNAATVRHIVERYPVASIRSGYLIGPWKQVRVVADGEEISLHGIEHDVLRVQWSDPRVHYAVNCASIGCPNLRDQAWIGATLDEDLTAAARDYINHPRGVTLRGNGDLRVSRIYKWFREDFGGTDAGVISHLREYADDDLRAALSGDVRIRGHVYDWSLNDLED